jgi:hypothetical protein
MERALAKMIVLAEVEAPSSQKFQQIAEIITMDKNLWFDQMKEGLSSVVQDVHFGAQFDERYEITRRRKHGG